MYICVPTPVGSGVEKSATSDSIVDIPNTRTRNGLTTLRNCLTTIIGSYFITNYPVPRVQSLRGRPLAASCLAPRPPAVSCITSLPRCRAAGRRSGRWRSTRVHMRHMSIAMPCARNLHGA